uniref:Predicted gene, EG240055 n=1 Tax=Mus musculus TaxID=10090 RepID=Q8C6S6_MOUSE|nr:Predicted gene, EG240055 [Mus musculus]AAI50867.1 Predicted gene, EG240055 [Mus musculus]BAC35592.1 unnamed protein product [Mus musculus]
MSCRGTSCRGASCRAALERDFRLPLSGTLRPPFSRSTPAIFQAYCPFVPCELQKPRLGWGGQGLPLYIAAISLPPGNFWKIVVSQAKQAPPLTGWPSWAAVLCRLRHTFSLVQHPLTSMAHGQNMRLKTGTKGKACGQLSGKRS